MFNYNEKTNPVIINTPCPYYKQTYLNINSVYYHFYSIASYKPSIKYIIKARRKWNDKKKEYFGITWLNDIINESIKDRFNDKKWNINISKQDEWDIITINKMV